MQIAASTAILLLHRKKNPRKNHMKRKLIVTCTTTLFAAFIAAAAAGAGQIRGQVTGAGAPIANSTVTLWAATHTPEAAGPDSNRRRRQFCA